MPTKKWMYFVQSLDLSYKKKCKILKEYSFFNSLILLKKIFLTNKILFGVLVKVTLNARDILHLRLSNTQILNDHSLNYPLGVKRYFTRRCGVKYSP